MKLPEKAAEEKAPLLSNASNNFILKLMDVLKRQALSRNR